MGIRREQFHSELDEMMDPTLFLRESEHNLRAVKVNAHSRRPALFFKLKSSMLYITHFGSRTARLVA